MSKPEVAPVQNPFPGPQPYRAADRERFFGREEMAQKLADRIFVHPALTLYGPSGAGKSSLMAAGVVPLLEDEHDMRVVRVDTWPADEVPLPWLTRALFGDLELGAVPEDRGGLAALEEALRLARLQSDRPLLLYLDQLEQILLPGRSPAQAAALFESLDGLASRAGRGLHLVLALREDYLGRLRDRARGRKALLEQGFRLGPLSVGEMVKAVVAAARKGVPAQVWDSSEIRKLILEVRVPGESATDEAEVQAAFGQIVCRALWNERAEGASPAAPKKAEEILRSYLDETVAKLGAWEAEARRLLEEHLVDGEGNRRPLTEKEARAELPEEAADEVLMRLEKEAVLRAEEHQGSRYFELGHDWLAKRVFEQREERKQREERERKEREREQKEREREEQEKKRREEERAARRRLGIIAAVAVAVAVVMVGVVIWALQQRDAAQTAQATAQDALDKLDVSNELLKKQAEIAKKNEDYARTQQAIAERAKDEQEKQKVAYQKSLDELREKLKKAVTVAELKQVQDEVKAKASLSPFTAPTGVGRDVPLPP